jgi:hypothetical protein
VRHFSKTILVVVLGLLASFSASGKSSKVVMSWKNPAYTGTKRFHRVLALGLSGNPVIRADFEDEMALRASATEMEIIPGNTILLRPEGAEFDLDYLKTQIREHKIDAVVVSRLVNIKNTVTYVPGVPYMPPYYNTFYGYYGTVYPMVYSPGYLKEEKKVRIETTFYSISSTEGELVWTCITDTFDSSHEKKAVEKLVKLVAKQMQREGVL